MVITSSTVADQCAAARRASRALAATDSAVRDAALQAIADALEARTREILEANARDMEAGREAGLGDALLDRLALDPGRILGDRQRRRATWRHCLTRSVS